MARDGIGLDDSAVAGADLSAKQFYAVKLNSNGEIVLAAAGEVAYGILQNNPAQGQTGAVRFVGRSKAVAGGAITAGDRVAADANGKLVSATAGRVNTSDAGAAVDPLIGGAVIGIAKDSAVAGDIFSLTILQLGAVPTTAA